MVQDLRRREALFIENFSPLQVLSTPCPEEQEPAPSTSKHECCSELATTNANFSDEVEDEIHAAVKEDGRNLPKGDRLGLALTVLVMFRELNLNVLKFTRLTELVLKNNIQCELYSKANFQFEFLARIGLCCPRLRVLDVFGTDTWADCLVAFFFKDAFHR